MKRNTKNRERGLANSQVSVATQVIPNKLVRSGSGSAGTDSRTSESLSDSLTDVRSGEASRCDHCFTMKSPIWRRGMNGELLCNACGLYWKHNGVYRPLSISSNRKSRQALQNNGYGLQAEQRRAPERDAKRKARSPPSQLDPPIVKLPQMRKPSKTFRTVVVPKAQVPNGTLLRFGTGGRTLETIDYLQQVPDLHGASGVKYVLNQGRLVFQGDHAAIKAADGRVYFVIVKDFVIEPDGGQMFFFTWLIPKENKLECISPVFELLDPAHFRVGPDHPSPEPIESLLTVFYSPQSAPKPLPALPDFCTDGEMIVAELSAAHALCDLR